MNILRNFLAAITASALSTTVFCAAAQNTSSALKLSTVVIDPGHGGTDAGCTSPSGKTMEKTIVLDIAKRLADKIKAGCPDVKVILTRETDVKVDLHERAGIANRNKANLFISIHVNSVEGKRNGPNGYSVHTLGRYTSKNKDLYASNMDVVRRENSVITLEDDYTTKYEGFDPNDPESYIFMNLMQNAFLEQSLRFAQMVDSHFKGGAIQRSRGVSQDPFLVLWRTAMPAILVECGFMSNSADRAALISGDGRERIASDLFDAFKEYKKAYDGGMASGREAKAAEEGPTVAPAAGEEDGMETSSGNGPAGEGAGDGPVRYGTQVLVSSRKMSPKDGYFKGYEAEVVEAGKYYKYIIGVSEDRAVAKEKNKKIKKIFPDSFEVKIENGETSRIK